MTGTLHPHRGPSHPHFTKTLCIPEKKEKKVMSSIKVFRSLWGLEGKDWEKLFPELKLQGFDGKKIEKKLGVCRFNSTFIRYHQCTLLLQLYFLF